MQAKDFVRYNGRIILSGEKRVAIDKIIDWLNQTPIEWMDRIDTTYSISPRVLASTLRDITIKGCYTPVDAELLNYVRSQYIKSKKDKV